MRYYFSIYRLHTQYATFRLFKLAVCSLYGKCHSCAALVGLIGGVLPHYLCRTSTQCKVLPYTWNRIKYKSPGINELQVIHIAVTGADKPCSAVCVEQLHTLYSIQVSHMHISCS